MKPARKPHWRASPELQQRARELRREMTPAERKLWQHLRDGQLDGAHFRKQYAIGHYILDFVCIKAKLVIEIDGDGHAEPAQLAHDMERTQWLSAQKRYRVLRFANAEVLRNVEGVVERIREVLEE